MEKILRFSLQSSQNSVDSIRTGSGTRWVSAAVDSIEPVEPEMRPLKSFARGLDQLAA